MKESEGRHDPGANRPAEQEALTDQLSEPLQQKVRAGTMRLSTALRIDARAGKLDANSAPILHHRLALLDRVANRNALSPSYRVLALTKDHVRAAAPFGVMRCPLDLKLTGEICVDAGKFLSVLHTSKAVFTARVTDHSLVWQCGPSTAGRLPAIDAAVAAPDFTAGTDPLSRSFGSGLERGAVGCGHSAFLRTAGLEAVQLVNRDGKAYAVASDSVMVSSCCLGPALASGRTVTLKPEAAALLAEVAQRAADDQEAGGMWLGVDANSVYCETGDYELQLYQLKTPQDYNLADKLRPYRKHQLTVPLYHEVVSAFLRRVEAHAEDRQQALVTLGLDDNRVLLSFAEIGGATEEIYRVDTTPTVSAPAVRIEARCLARGLVHATELVFDYAKENILVLRGEDEFLFGITGRR